MVVLEEKVGNLKVLRGGNLWGFGGKLNFEGGLSGFVVVVEVEVEVEVRLRVSCIVWRGK